ncbi:hypothetical protein [Frigoriglobus tundricola]|uniref:Uncharacterized protein n=1 Tax=Frigoriglobus tundricola TaxID=2774151 RepID=A0A6M5YWW7_9BACT|nr:hypothetical protein [Frigoriglobus tundricola]QJW98597.1 hypothetical protein FTUN_6192 [Frigoriglobus tundricola]
MRRSRWLPALLASIVAACAISYACIASARHTRPTLAVRDAYLLVSVEAPPAWAEQHRPSIMWGGKEVRLPVVFRGPFTGTSGPEWGATPEEAKQSLTMMGVEVPVRVTPTVACRVSNEPAFGLIPERGGKRRETTLSVATWVTVGPADRPAVIGSNEVRGRAHAAGEYVLSQIEELVAAGHVIDVEPRP